MTLILFLLKIYGSKANLEKGHSRLKHLVCDKAIAYSLQRQFSHFMLKYFIKGNSHF